MDRALNPIADGVWTDTHPVSFLGLRLSTNMTVLRLSGGSLLVHSPVALTPERRAAIDALGPVSDLYAPNTMHYLWLAEWSRAYPAARVHAPTALVRKLAGVRIDRPLDGAGDASLSPTLDEVRIDGFRLYESVLHHRPSNTLVVSDLVHNVGRPAHGWTRAYTKADGFYDRVALSRVIRWTGFSNRRAARRSVDAVLALPFERVLLGHGNPLLEGAKAKLAEAYGWLA